MRGIALRRRSSRTPPSRSTSAFHAPRFAKHGWVRYDAPPRDISPAAKLAQRTDAFVKAVGAIAPVQDSSDQGAPDQGATPPAGAPDESPSDGAAMAAWLRREVQAQIVIIRTLREKERAEPLTEERALLLGRMLVQLTDTFIKLSRHTEGGSPVANNHDDFPEGIDEFRIKLARRIDAFVASRANTADAVQPDGSGTERV